MYLPGKYKELSESFPQLNNNDLVDYCQFMLDTEQYSEDESINKSCTRLLAEGLCYHVPID